MIKADNDIKVMVDYEVAPALANLYIANLTRQSGESEPQEFARILATSVAACAFMMLSANDKETVKQIFGTLVDDASKHFEHRKKLLAEKVAKKDAQ